MMNQMVPAKSADYSEKSLYTVGGLAALLAMATSILDVALGFGNPEIGASGSKTAVAWFAVFRENWPKGLYVLGILNIVYMACLVPLYFAIATAHRHKNWVFASMATIVFFIGMAIYIANNTAIPMLVLSNKYFAAATETQKAVFAAAGEAVLASGEDFTPGAFIGTIASGITAIAISWVMLRGGIFGKTTAWIGIVGFTFLSVFTILSTFVPMLYFVTFYAFGVIGGLLAMSWFALTARRLFQLGREFAKAEAG